jgi:hypothetical protein
VASYREGRLGLPLNLWTFEDGRRIRGEYVLQVTSCVETGVRDDKDVWCLRWLKRAANSYAAELTRRSDDRRE